jgi:hypothetical protein
MIKQIKNRQLQFELVQKYSHEFNLDYNLMFSILSEFKSLLADNIKKSKILLSRDGNQTDGSDET